MQKQSGQILVLAIIVVGFVLLNALAIIGGATIFSQNSNYSVQSAQAINLAEAGIDKALASLNKTGGSYNGETETSFGEGSYSVTITSSPSNNAKVIESTGYIPSKANPKITRTIKITASKGLGVSFNYGVQVGEGGLQMSDNSVVNGSIYSNGNIVMNNNAQITGDAYVAGGSEVTADEQSDCTEPNCDFVFGKNVGGNDRLDVAQSFMPSSSNYLSRVAVKLKKFGNPPDMPVRLLADNNGKPDKNGVLASGTLTANLVTNEYGFIDVTFISAPYLNTETPYWIMLNTSSNSSNYWSWSADPVQSYTRGQAKWSSNWQNNPAWNNISADLSFKTYMGGVITYIQGGTNGTIIGGNAYANTLRNLTINKDAYYQTQQNITVSGGGCTNNSHCHSSSPDPAPKVMPISDANITAWKNQAAASGPCVGGHSGVCTGNITSCIPQLGPGKFIGDVSFSNNCTVTIIDPIWITGDLLLNNGVTLRLDSSYGSSSGVIVIGDVNGGGKITLSNNAIIQGSGTSSSILMALSTFDSRGTDDVKAIEVKNGGNFGVLYAPLGIINVENGNHLKELTAWKIELENNVVIDYDSGLSSVFFTSGPQGAYSFIKGTYQVK